MVFPQVYLSLFLAGCAKRVGRAATSVVYICNETADSPFSRGAISGVPRGRYLRPSAVAIGEMQYFYIENYIQLSRYSGDLEANQECETGGRLKADDLRIFVFFLF